MWGCAPPFASVQLSIGPGAGQSCVPCSLQQQCCDIGRCHQPRLTSLSGPHSAARSDSGSSSERPRPTARRTSPACSCISVEAARLFSHTAASFSSTAWQWMVCVSRSRMILQRQTHRHAVTTFHSPSRTRVESRPVQVLRLLRTKQHAGAAASSLSRWQQKERRGAGIKQKAPAPACMVLDGRRPF